MSVRTDVINLNVNINGDKGKNELNQLKKRAADLKSEMQSLNRRTAEGREQYQKYKQELAGVDARMAELRKQIGITALSQKELVAELKRLQGLKNIATPQTKEFFELQRQIDAVNTRLRNVRSGTFGFKAALGSLKDEVKQFGVLAASYLGFQFLTDQTRNLINAQAKMADGNANIAKTTSLTNAEIKELNKNFKEMDTRTSNSRLRELAAEAGKLGVDGVENLKRFVKEANVIEVALGEDLGDDGLIKISKAANILKEDMIGLASGINAVGANSAASEGYQVDFAFRMAGTAQAARIAAGDILGLSAALELNGQTTEVSATALNVFFQDFVANTEKFGKAAGYAKGELSSLVNSRGVNEAFLSWLQQLKALSPTTDAFINKLREVGVDGARGSGVMLALSENIGLVREQQALANSEIAKGTSVIDEYNKKNNNFAATVDKLKKDMNSMFTSDAVNKFITGAVEGLGKLLKILPDVLDFIKRNTTALMLFGSAWFIQTATYANVVAWLSKMIAGVKGLTAAQLLSTAATKADIIVTTSLGVVKALLTANIIKLRQEWKLLTAAIGANPLGILLIAAGALLVLLNEMKDRTERINAVTRRRLEIEKEAANMAGRELAQLELLKRKTQDLTLSIDQRRKAVEELQRLYPDIFGNLTTEAILAGQVADAYDRATRAIMAKARSQAYEGALEKVVVDLDEAKKKIDEIVNSSGIPVSVTDDGYYQVMQSSVMAQQRGILSILNTNISAYNAKLKESKQLTDTIIEAQKQAASAIPKVEHNLVGGNPPSGDDPKAQRELNRLRKLQEEILALKTEIEATEADREQSSTARDNREIVRVLNKYQKLLAQAKDYIKETAELNELQGKELDILFAKQFERRTDQEYEQSLKSLKVYYEKQTNITRQGYLSGELTKKQYTLRLQELDAAEAQDRLIITKDYADTVIKATEDLEKARTAILQKGVEDREVIEKQSLEDNVFSAERAALTATPGSNAELQARKNVLEARFEMETAFLDRTSEEYLLHQAQLNSDLQDLDRSFWAFKLQFALEQLQGLADIYSGYLEIQNEKDSAELERQRNNNEQSKKFYQRQLDSKLISRATYDHHINQMDDEMEVTERAYKKRAAKRARSAAIFNAILSTAQGVARAYADYAWPYNLIVSAIVGGLGAVQIAKATSTPEPVGRKGLIIPGPSHEDGGVDLVERKSGKTLANVEGGEPLWVFSKATYRNNKEILNELMYNSQKRNGARIVVSQSKDVQPSINAIKIAPLLQQQPTAPAESVSVDMTATNALLAEIIAHTKDTAKEVATMKTKLKAVIAYKDFKDKEDLLYKAKSVSGINQEAA